MKVNNTSLQGVFKYSPNNITYEAGDFIIDDDVIYKCLNEITSSSDIDPSKNENFEVYLAGKIADPENIDYESDDKYISPVTFVALMKKCFSGFDMNGVIRNTIIPERAISLFIQDGIDSYTEPLDNIMVDPEINNAIYQIHSSDIVGAGAGDDDGDGYLLILRQYTGKSGETWYRMQELIDPYLGSCYYRYIEKTGNSWEIPSDIVWKNPCIDTEFKSEVEYVINYYKRLINKEISKYVIDKSNFRFKKLSGISSTQVVMSSIEVPWKSGIIFTVLVDSMDNYGRHIPTNFTFTMVDPSTQVVNRNYLQGNITLTLTENRNNDTLTFSVSGGINTRITSVYYQENYENSNPS